MGEYRIPVSIAIARPLPNVIEYAVTQHDPISGDETRIYHANREATFFGPHTGSPARQVGGRAASLWRADDVTMLEAFRQVYGGHTGGGAIRNVALGEGAAIRKLGISRAAVVAE